MKIEKLHLQFNTNTKQYIDTHSSGSREPLFAFVSPPKSGTIAMLTDLTYCRESMCEYIRQELRNIAHNDINMSKLHMIIHRKVYSKFDVNLEAFRNQVLTGQRMANAIEKHYGWPLTKIYPVTTEEIKSKNVGFYYIYTGKRWMKSPIMLSLYTLLFRLATNNQKYKFKNRIKSIKSLFNVLHEVCERCNYTEAHYFEAHGGRWKLVLDNYRKLFGGRNMKDQYYPGGGDYYFSEGINSLCDESSRDVVLNKDFCKIVEKHNKKTGEDI